MKRLWPLVALGIAAYLVFALVTLPASVITSRLPAGVVVAGVEGTVWNGRAPVLAIGGTSVGAVSWTLRGLKADVKVTRSDGFLQALVAPKGGSGVSLSDLTGSLPLGSLPPAAVPGGWTGTVNARLGRLVLQDGWPTDTEGTIEILDLTGPARQPVNRGSYKIVFPPDQPVEGELVGALSDLGGALEIAGNLRLLPDRSYVIEGTVLARPEASKSLVDSLQYLGPPDAQGRRQFSLAGTM